MNRGIRPTAAGIAATALLLAGCGETAPQNVVTAEPAPPVNQVVEEAKMREEVAVVENAGLLPPGAAIDSREAVAGAIAFDFRAAAAPDRLVHWYRDDGEDHFKLVGEMKEGDEHVLSGTTRDPAGEFSVRLAPDGRGGTTGIVLVTPTK